MGINELSKERRSEILRLAATYGAPKVRIFGSVARVQAGPESDRDFLIDLEPGRTLFDLGGVLYELRELLGISVDVVPENGLHENVRSNVIEEARPL